MESVAVRNRWVLAATCVLVALGLLLCAERASLAKQPVRVPDPVTPQRSVGQGPESAPVAQSRPAAPRAERPVRGEPANTRPTSRPAERPARPRPAGAPQSDPRSPAAQSRLVRGEGVHRGPVSRPAHRPPAEHGALIDRGKPAHVPREYLQGHSRGPQKPVGQGPVRPHPEKPVDRGPVSHPDQRPTPKPKPVHEPRDIPQGGPRGSEDTGRPEGAGAHGQQGGSEGLPDKVNTHMPGDGGPEAPEQTEVHPGQGTDNAGGHLPAAVGKDSEGGGTGYEGTAANKPAGEPPSGTGMAQHPDLRAASAVLPGHEPGSGTHSTEGPSRRPAKAAADTPATHPTAAHREDPVRPAGDSSPPDQQVARHSWAVEAASPAASGERLPAEYGVRAASEPFFGSTEYFFGYLWDGSSFSVQRDGDGLGPMQDGARGFVPDDAARRLPHAAGAPAADPVSLLRLRSHHGRPRFQCFVLRRRRRPAVRRDLLLPLCRSVAGAVSRLRRIAAGRNGTAAGTRTPRLILLAQGAPFALPKSYVVPTYGRARRKHERVAEAQRTISRR